MGGEAVGKEECKKRQTRERESERGEERARKMRRMQKKCLR